MAASFDVLATDGLKVLGTIGFFVPAAILIALVIGIALGVTLGPHAEAVSLAGKLEMELAELPPEDAAELAEMYGITESGLAVVIQCSYRLARLISFFTVGEDECRAWTIRDGSPAVDAAGAIHSDLARGFIRAEVIHWDQLLEAQTYAEARKRGQLRSEGKAYTVQDGDVLNILFNV